MKFFTACLPDDVSKTQIRQIRQSSSKDREEKQIESFNEYNCLRIRGRMQMLEYMKAILAERQIFSLKN